ncbi:MAG TPA: membrane dipeptidase, partial [Planctomycetaceae bacterium]|nr:membrane dipeptidase [Planctomycetaceae bacterium]
HLDMAWNALEWNRDLLLPVSKIRDFEQQYEEISAGPATVSWDALRQARVGIVVCTLLARLNRRHKDLSVYQSHESAYAACHGQLAYYRALDERGVLKEIADKSSLEQVLVDWISSSTGKYPIGYILSMEGSEAILSPTQIPAWFEAGLRILGPAHYGANAYCSASGSKEGLTDDGRKLLTEMERVGILLDVTHLSERSFDEALDVFGGPVLASHCSCRSLVPGVRPLSDGQIRAIAERRGVIGVSLDAWMLVPGWEIGVTTSERFSLENVADHLDHICQVAGDAEHSGIGSDLDGGYGKDRAPRDLDTVADLPKLAEVLDRRGYSPEDIDGMLYLNWINFFRSAWHSPAPAPTHTA